MMGQFLISMFTAASLSLLSFAQQTTENSLANINLNGASRVVVRGMTEVLNLEKNSLENHKLVLGKIARYNVTAVSPSFLAKDGEFIVVMVKDPSSTIKFLIINGDAILAEDVTLIEDKKITFKNGEISSSLDYFRR